MRSLVLSGLTALLAAPPADAQYGQAPSPAVPPVPAQTSPYHTIPVAGPARPANPATPGERRAAPPALVENLQTFDPDTLELTWTDNRWRLTVGGAVLKDFGRRESEGRQAERLLRTLRLTQHGTIGSTSPVLEYWLADGRAPQGPVPGYAALTFDAASLHVEESQGQWCLRDERRVLFNFGADGQDAHRALAVLRKYGFSQVIAVGSFAPSVLVFLAPPNGEPAAREPRKPSTHESAEAAARKAQELKRLKDRFPGIDAETVLQPALHTLRAPDQPRQPFSGPALQPVGGGPLPGPHAAPSADHGDRVPFDWRQVQVRLEGSNWLLAAGGLVLANFGPDADAARRALDVVRYYRFTERRVVGRPTPRFSYFLVNGVAPRGAPFGVAGQPFRPDALKVNPIAGGLALFDGDRPLVALGESPDEAADLLAAIRRQRFDLLCSVGRPEAGFTFLARSR